MTVAHQVERFKPDQLDRLDDYFRLIADRLGLKDWNVTIGADRPKDDDAILTCNPCYGRKIAYIRVSDSFFTEWDEGQVRSAVVHELIHCHLDGIDTAVCLAEKAVDPIPFAMLHQATTDAIEWATDGLADAVAPFFPLMSEVPSA